MSSYQSNRQSQLPAHHCSATKVVDPHFCSATMMGGKREQEHHATEDRRGVLGNVDIVA
jgi:hypothetical protein